MVNKNQQLDNLNFHVKGIEAERLIINTSGVAISTGSACTSGEIQSSHVLRAMGLSDQAARESFRVSLSHLVNRDEIEFACKQIASSIMETVSSHCVDSQLDSHHQTIEFMKEIDDSPKVL